MSIGRFGALTSYRNLMTDICKCEQSHEVHEAKLEYLSVSLQPALGLLQRGWLADLLETLWDETQMRTCMSDTQYALSRDGQ